MTDEVFGIHAVTAILEARPGDITSLSFQDNYQKNKKLRALYEQARQRRIPCRVLNRQEMDALSDGGNHQGVLASIRVKDLRLTENQLEAWLTGIQGPKLILLLDQIQDPHNLGACLRTAAAAGVQLVIAPKDGAAPITPVVRKIACGATERVPYLQVTNLVRTMKKLQALGVWFTGTDLAASDLPYDIDFTGDVAIVIGSEGKGLRRLVKAQCDYLVKIPMPGEMESLNASVATGVMLFEVVRQRI